MKCLRCTRDPHDTRIHTMHSSRNVVMGFQSITDELGWVKLSHTSCTRDVVYCRSESHAIILLVFQISYAQPCLDFWQAQGKSTHLFSLELPLPNSFPFEHAGHKHGEIYQVEAGADQTHLTQLKLEHVQQIHGEAHRAYGCRKEKMMPCGNAREKRVNEKSTVEKNPWTYMGKCRTGVLTDKCTWKISTQS